MMKKSEMAEWILDFFRRAKVDAGQIVMFRSIQHKLYELNPKERELFVPVANELINNGYFSYEDGTPQCLRLTEKGRDYIYDPDAVLDCCQDRRRASKKDYLKVVEVGLKLAEMELRGETASLDDVLMMISDAVKSIDDEELLSMIDRHVGIVEKMKSIRPDAIISNDVKETVRGAVEHLESFGEQEKANHLKKLL